MRTSAPPRGSERVGVAVVGAGLVGIDLIEKIRRSPALDCLLVVGRDEHSVGLRRAAQMGCATVVGGVAALLDSGLPVRVVFDASNADCHAGHWSWLEATDLVLIDLTPAERGRMIVPTVNGSEAADHRHLGLVSCGGQVAIPILHAVAGQRVLDYVEVVCTAASASAGRATRQNLDHYLETTEAAISAFTGAADVKVLVNLSPATPAPPFRVVMSIVATGIEPGVIRAAVQAAAEAVRVFVPGFTVTSCTATGERVRVVVEVTATGDRVPRYAGNLDIITAAAVFAAEQHTPQNIRGGSCRPA